MKVLRVRPKHYPEVIDIDCSLESLQKEVEGPIQAVYLWDDEVALICNEEGKLHDDCMEKLNRNSTSVMRLLITSRTTTGTTIRWITTWFITRTSAILRRRDIYGRTSQSR